MGDVGLLEALYLLLGQRELAGGQGVGDVPEPGGADDGRGHAGTAEQPGQRDLGRGRAATSWTVGSGPAALAPDPPEIA